MLVDTLKKLICDSFATHIILNLIRIWWTSKMATSNGFGIQVLGHRGHGFPKKVGLIPTNQNHSKYVLPPWP